VGRQIGVTIVVGSERKVPTKVPNKGSDKRSRLTLLYPIDFNLVGLKLNLKSYPSNLYVYGYTRG
jgi:hypothetical protein